ncbi:hypothetical protein HGM15179_019960 [Zosterops borbonicus]|uniref:Uncharacterized protein n=1 Tax=Zosterops borbonicus TaxID=364589 RepID=A0A8K1FUM0_9PASS|nr:hypothetical protein HGM15179_019960 [Zosterops borbonicus]
MNFVDAGNAFKKADPQEAVNCLLRAIEIYTDMGRFTIAAKHHVGIAEIYESDLLDVEKVGKNEISWKIWEIGWEKEEFGEFGEFFRDFFGFFWEFLGFFWDFF